MPVTPGQEGPEARHKIKGTGSKAQDQGDRKQGTRSRGTGSKVGRGRVGEQVKHVCLMCRTPGAMLPGSLCPLGARVVARREDAVTWRRCCRCRSAAATQSSTAEQWHCRPAAAVCTSTGCDSRFPVIIWDAPAYRSLNS
eukprot:364494-Chlamydomonas_euryale.AAC.9